MSENQKLSEEQMFDIVSTNAKVLGLDLVKENGWIFVKTLEATPVVEIGEPIFQAKSNGAIMTFLVGYGLGRVVGMPQKPG